MQRSCAEVNSQYKRKCYMNQLGGPSIVHSLLWGAMGQCSSLHWCTGRRESSSLHWCTGRRESSSLHLWDGEGAGLSWCSPFRVLTPPMVASIGSSWVVKYRSETKQEIRCRAKKNIRRICKHSRSPGIDSKESIPPACVAWRTGMTTIFLLGSLPP